MKKTVFISMTCLSLFSGAVTASYFDSFVKVDNISVWVSNGDILVKTDPRPDISSLNCTNDYWLVLRKSSPGYQATLSMLLTAQTNQRTIIVRADDASGDQFCDLARVVTTRN